MTTNIQSQQTERQGLVYVIIGILVFGSLWGLSEVALGGGLHATQFPYRAGLLAGIGMALMGMALVIHKKPAMLIGIGLVAVLVKLLAVPMLHISVTCKANSCIAVFTEAVALSLIAFLLLNQMGKSVHARMGSGALAAIIASVGFYFIGMNVAPCNYLLSFSPGGFIVTEGLIWAAFSAILLPLGYLAGEKLAAKNFSVLARRPLYYATSVVMICLSWGLSALAIAAGL
ncbi:MAG: hypothetical protein DRI01_09160 [Chloroflexi bacterium]|nr:MAG: hypothetical protein DRI01_09160 [Chloroflexota bacterium]